MNKLSHSSAYQIALPIKNVNKLLLRRAVGKSAKNEIEVRMLRSVF